MWFKSVCTSTTYVVALGNLNLERKTRYNYWMNSCHTSFFFLGLLPPSSSSSELLFFEVLESLERPNGPVLDLLPPLLGVELPPLLFL